MVERYDIVVVGGGSAGLVVAAVAAPLGYKVALLEGHKMGGDCLNYGCVPSKALLAAAKLAHLPEVAENFGIDMTAQADMAKVMAQVKNVIGQIAPHDSPARFRALGVEVIEEFGRFENSRTLITESGRKLRGRRVVLATGSRAAVPPIPGLDRVDYLTNETVFELQETPEHLLILGGGPIGMEMAQAFQRLGSTVTVLEMGPRILPHDAPALTVELQQLLAAEGIKILTDAQVVQVDQHEKGFSVAYKKDGKAGIVHGSHLLVAAGRIPNIEKLDLGAAGIRYERDGIIVDRTLRTNRKHVYALGDVAKGKHGLVLANFTHMAGEMATLFVKRVLFGSFWAKADFILPWVTYTDPELAHVGMTEAQAEQQLGTKNYKITTAHVKDVDRYRAERATAGMIRVISNKQGVVLGMSCLAKDAGELLPVWGLMIGQRMKLNALSRVIHAYPTRSELNRKVVSAYYKPVLTARKTKWVSRILYRLFG